MMTPLGDIIPTGSRGGCSTRCSGGDDFDKDYFNLVSYESGEGMRVGKNKLTEASKIFSIEFPDFMGDKGEGAVKDMKKGSYDNEDARSKRGK